MVVNGSISQNNPNVPPPPVLTKPTFTWNRQHSSPTTGTAAQITTAMNTARNNLQGTFYSNNTSGTIVFPTNATVTGPLTVIAEGKVDLGRTLSISGGPQVTVVAKSTALDAIDFAQSFTAASGLHVLLYTVGGVDGRNTISFTGAIYANSIDAKNNFTIHELRVPEEHGPPVGFTWDFGRLRLHGGPDVVAGDRAWSTTRLDDAYDGAVAELRLPPPDGVDVLDVELFGTTELSCSYLVHAPSPP